MGTEKGEKMKNFRILPINSSPIVKNYTYHAFLQAIISSSKFYDQSCAEIEVENFDPTKWKVVNDQLEYKVEENKISFFTNPWMQGMNEVFYRKCEEEDSIVLTIHKQVYTNPWGRIDLFVTDQTSEIALLKEEQPYRFGNLCGNGIFTCYNNSEYAFAEAKLNQMPKKLKIERKKDVVTAYLLSDHDQIKIKEWNVEERNITYIGFQAKLSDSVSINWTYSNYIHMMYDIIGDVHLDYIHNPIKNWVPYTYNMFIDYKVESKSLIKKYGVCLMDYIKYNIDAGNYIQYENNVILLHPITDQRDKFHHTLIYGYDDEKELFYVLQLVKGIPKEKTISYNDFMSERNSRDNDEVVVMVLKPDMSTYMLTGEYIAEELSDYLLGIDPQYKVSFRVMNRPLIFGIKILEYLLTEKGMEEFCNDLRIASLLAERAALMKNRMEVLRVKEILFQEDYDKYIGYAQALEKNTMILRNLVLKNKIVRGCVSQEIFYQYLTEVYETEKNFYPKLIHAIHRAKEAR